MADTTGNYALDLPDSTQVKNLLRDSLELYERRNALIMRSRRSLLGQNPIKAPTLTQYKIQPQHTYFLLAAVNEKVSRFEDMPEIKVTPVGVSSQARNRSTTLEHVTNRMHQVVEEQSGGMVWSRQVFDAILTDGGVARIERAPAAMWPEITMLVDKDGNPWDPAVGIGKQELLEYNQKFKFERVFEDPAEYEKFREVYKQGLPLPLRKVYVPHEYFLPIWEGPTMVEALEIERRPLRSVLQNKLFQGPGLMQLQGAVGANRTPKQEVVILHYCNQKYHAYFALSPGTANRTANIFPTATQPTDVAIGTPVLLHAYPHRLGRTQYNYVAGRAGGWRGANNPQMESVMEAVLELEKDADELRSQIATALRAQGWPTLIAYYDKDSRGSDDALPQPPKIQEGQNIAMWKDERLEPAFPPMNLEAATAVMQMQQARISELVGSAAVFGQNQPGVTTGYHDALQIDQSEHLDSRIEQNVCSGAEDATRLMYAHVVAMNEKLQLFDVRQDKKNQDYGDYVPLDPKWLTPMPQISAKVKSDRPTNYMQNMQVFLQATADRAGPGTPAVPDDWGREKLLGITNPDEIQKMIDAQTARRTAMGSGVVGDLILQRLKMKQVAAETPNISGSTAAQADPALQQAVQGMNGPGGEAEQTGGVAPSTLSAELQGRAAAGVPQGIQGVGGGNAPGNPQMPEVMANTQRLMQGQR